MACLWRLLLGLSIFIERPYCKYICPLGAALADAQHVPLVWPAAQAGVQHAARPARLAAARWPLTRDGRIDHRECLHCLDCLVLYTDPKVCPPLARSANAANVPAWK